MAVGPPATGTCHTMVRYGVGRWTESEPHGGTPVMCRTSGRTREWSADFGALMPLHQGAKGHRWLC